MRDDQEREAVARAARQARCPHRNVEQHNHRVGAGAKGFECQPILVCRDCGLRREKDARPARTVQERWGA